MPDILKDIAEQRTDFDAHLADYASLKSGLGTRLSSLEENHMWRIYSTLGQIGSSNQDDLEGIFSKMPNVSLLSFHASTAHSALLGLGSVGHYITIQRFGNEFASVQAINRTTGVLKINSRIESGFIGWTTIG